ncbi:MULTISPECIES: polysaccharide biosynthesis/export family protein [unclassified Hahella]|uniref:polysaccharide biosynthesis/export family protein n=1 Tax=unclassified Hahella TaxID=2624107 RepID=UPI001C1F1766|nr:MULTISPECIES: polysaccharide biosynthesis/export family protein [unclassified Hahella]MBU6952248.1 polysaccharide export protein [Hahella sp. HN01]MDG9667596.1 polysaccharide export protein [Hahella sp. CR1]
MNHYRKHWVAMVSGVFLSALMLLASILIPAQRSFAEEGLSEYTLGSGDYVRVQVYGESDLTLEARLSDAGTVSYPFLGEIKVLGLTVSRLQELIANGLRDGYLVDPKVSVTILEYRKFFINGEVKNPGGFSYQPGLTVRKAASLAGGFTNRANKNKIFIITENDPNQTQRPADQSTRVHPGDIIIVEESFF